MLLLGVDPGLSGALGWLDATGAYVGVDDLPTMLAGKATGAVKTRVNVAGLAELIRDRTKGETCMAYVEQQMGYGRQMGRASVFSIGRTFGAIEGVLGGLLIPIHIVHAQVWKKHFALPRKDKERARALAIELFPAASLARKKDKDRAEALLIASWGWRAYRLTQGVKG